MDQSDSEDNDDGTFEFAFNNQCFSDRVLKIEVITGSDIDKAYAMWGDYASKRLQGLKNVHVKKISKDIPSPRVQQIHLSSVILAAKSRFFLKLFSNGMQETDPKCPSIIKIDASEFDPLMELLHFMYGGKLSTTTEGCFIALLDVLILADKFEVRSCFDHCVRLLSNLDMTLDSASLSLEIASHVFAGGNIQPLADKAKKFLTDRCKDVTKLQEDLSHLTCSSIEVIFSSDDIRVPSEDDVYDIVMKWARTQFSTVQERHAVLGSCVTRIVRFPYMSNKKLREILLCDDLDREFVKDVVNEALFFKAEPPIQKWALKESLMQMNDRKFIKRDYTRSIFYFDLSLDQCMKLSKGQNYKSGIFYVGKHSFSLAAHNFARNSTFMLLLKLEDYVRYELEVQFQFAAMKKPEMSFVNKITSQHKFTSYASSGYPLFDTTWESSISIDNPYFIDQVLHLRAEVSIIE